ncbi:hypothetical protein FMUND_13014 [Fusarium mundagurra]|uniref:Cdc24/Scd1 N-terminal domain-containing protein n=1 Tax=Fusarium mundagurra TaxID=1567541 RepID=A0A8H5Y200_9HYPO|nr:hypothetical protein FMUND_13014 [Fusarium mundagurra]
MDPLSVIASVAGIATAAGEVIKILGQYTNAAKDAPKIAAEVSSEALATQTVITGLEQLINNFSAANVRYASLIQVDQLTAVLFDGVKIFSELLAVLQTLPPLEPSSPGGSLWTPIQWIRKKSSLTAMLQRLQTFKSSIVCILSILQSDSQARAEESQHQLIAAVDDLLRGNTDLSRRMIGMENTIDTMSHRRATIQPTRDMDASKGKGASSRRSSLFEFDFEHDLKLSRVYRNAKRDTMDCSVRSSMARTHAWSSLSGISLSDISHISVLALPLYVEDISNPEHYNFGQEAIQPTSLLPLTILTRSICHDCIEVQLQLSQFKWFAQFQQQESPKNENLLSRLISIFRLGTPLLMLFNELDSSHHERWKDLMASSPSEEVSRLAITEFVKECMLSSDIPGSYCIFDADILLTDTTHHVKLNQLYVFQEGILQVVELSPKDGRRGMLGYGKPSLSDRPKARLPVIKIIAGKDIKEVRRVLLLSKLELYGCEIEWFDYDDKECSMTFTLSSKTRSLEWMYQATKVKDHSRLNFSSHDLQRIVVREYRLVILGALVQVRKALLLPSI